MSIFFKLSHPRKYLLGKRCTHQLNRLPVLSQAFRPFFLLGAAFSILAMGVWLLALNGGFRWQHPLAPSLWHAHEMLFGFAASIFMGFLLTAVNQWTGLTSISPSVLLGVILLWSAARVCFFVDFFVGNTNLLLLALLLQIFWWLSVIGSFSRTLFRAKSRHNYIFIILLSVLMLINVVVVLLGAMHRTQLALQFTHLTLFVFSMMMGVVAGRVIPFFISRSIPNFQSSPKPLLDKSILFFSIVGAAIYILSSFFTLPFKAWWFMLAIAFLHLVRLCYWFTPDIVKHPLLLSLYVAYSALMIGIFLLALSYFPHVIAFKDALHLITIGAMGLMILSMMARVSLGHTNRKIISNSRMNIAFLLLLIAALIRSLGVNLLNMDVVISWKISAFLWMAGFTLFLFQFASVLYKPKSL